MVFSRNQGLILLISLLAFIPLVSFWEDLALTVRSINVQEPSDSDRLAAFNSYKLNSPLFEAVRNSDLGLTRSLLEGGISENSEKQIYYNVNAEDPKGLTPIIEATLLGNRELVDLLLLHGAHAQPSPGFRHTPLRAACLTANIELIALLLQKGADPNAMSEGGRTPLMGACYLRPEFDKLENRAQLSFKAVKLMLEDSRTDPRIRNEFGESALDLCKQRSYNMSVVYLRNRLGGHDTKSDG